MSPVALSELGTVHAWWCQAPLCDGCCRATVKAGQVKAVTVLDDGVPTVVLTSDDGNQIVLPRHVAQVIARHITATTDPATLPGGAR